MKYNFKDLIKTKDRQFGKLGLWYILALSTIATVIIAGQVLVQHHLRNQLNDSRVVNIAGRQRMLSQQIAKLALEYQLLPTDSTKRDLQAAVQHLQIAHEGLQHGNDSLGLPGQNSEIVTDMFKSIQPHYLSILKQVQSLIAWPARQGKDENVRKILTSEKLFLVEMDRIVNQYDREASTKVQRLRFLEYVLPLVSLLVISFEVIFIFRPAARHVNRTVENLVASEKNASKMAKEISAIYHSLEKSYEQLAKVNEPDEIPKLWARADKGGNIISITDHFQSFTDIIYRKGMRICDLFSEVSAKDDFMDELVEHFAATKNWSSQMQIKKNNEVIWVDASFCPTLNAAGEVEEILVIGADITPRKQAELKMSKKNKNEIEKKINRQKYRSVLILEGQEEERKRLAMDIHDGIGQLLTALKFQIESIDPLQGNANVLKLQEIKSQLNNTIREVRRITFNLKPTVLGDYGLSAGLKLFVHEISKFSTTELHFTDHSTSSERYPQRIENNVFRIVQEAINNAFKYAKASRIEVTLSRAPHQLVVQVKDDGMGFEQAKLKEIGIESGSGFFNMHERTEYINGNLEIDTQPGHGTTIRLEVPIKQKTLE